MTAIRVATALLALTIGMVALAAEGAGREKGDDMFLTEKDIMGVIGQVQAEVGTAHRKRVATGVRQAARLWRKEDGTPAEFAAFCKTQFMTGKKLDGLFERFERKLELLGGHFNTLTLQLRLEMDEARGPLLPVDKLFAAYSPGAHVTEDFFDNKLAFIVLLNFPVPDLDELIRKGSRWSRRRWAEARLAQGFAHRVPAEVKQEVNRAYAVADDYIYNYNIRMDHVVDEKGEPIFRKGLRLISHWGLRDELKALYNAPEENLPKQEMIQTIMLRIINQQIPAVVIDNPKVDWNPVANTVDGKKAAREPDTRFVRLLEVFRAHRREDPHYPEMPSHIHRRFEQYREIPEDEFVELLESVLKAPVSKKVAALIGKRLGRDLRPFDIWYDGFKARGKYSQDKLDRMVRERYPELQAFQDDLPGILSRLGFDQKTASFLAAHIEVDPARGAGHAWGPEMRTEKAHLRTRVPEKGMNYKGFNIAMHELGHNVEQVFSLYRLDHTLLAGVPNTAFTEGFAFVFQARDLDVLGLAEPDEKTEALEAIDNFWMTREIAGVGLVDIRVWHWMYDHPDASPAALRKAVVSIAKDVWNQYYAPVFGVEDSPILAIYSHMINSGLYLPDYPLGYIIAFQVEHYFKSHELAGDMERMCALGNLTPDLWMKKAVGRSISTRPLIRATQKALQVIGK